jgi:flagellar assembly factor FliW
MRIKTSRFGEIDINPDRIITMTVPFLGFPDCHSFVLRPHKPDSPFMWLQAVDSPELAFVVIQAAAINREYNPLVPAGIKEELKINKNDELDMLLILTVPQEKPREMTANLLGPVVINPRERLARQLLLDPGKYDPCWPVFEND